MIWLRLLYNVWYLLQKPQVFKMWRYKNITIILIYKFIILRFLQYFWEVRTPNNLPCMRAGHRGTTIRMGFALVFFQFLCKYIFAINFFIHSFYKMYSITFRIFFFNIFSCKFISLF